MREDWTKIRFWYGGRQFWTLALAWAGIDLVNHFIFLSPVEPLRTLCLIVVMPFGMWFAHWLSTPEELRWQNQESRKESREASGFLPVMNPPFTKMLWIEFQVVAGLSILVMILSMIGGRLDNAFAAIAWGMIWALVRGGHAKRWVTGIDATRPPDRFIDPSQS